MPTDLKNGAVPRTAKEFLVLFDLNSAKRMLDAVGLGFDDVPLLVGGHEASGQVGGQVIDGVPMNVMLGETYPVNPANNEIAVSEANKLRGEPGTCSPEDRRSHDLTLEQRDAARDEVQKILSGN